MKEQKEISSGIFYLHEVQGMEVLAGVWLCPPPVLLCAVIASARQVPLEQC